jgi:hypothetical protein
MGQIVVWYYSSMRRLLAVMFLSASLALPQCVMCGRTAAAQNVERQKVLNSGILILLMPPFAIMAGLATLAWRRRR